MRGTYDKAYIEDAFRTLGNTMTHPVTCYLIGGGAMAFRDLKDATKDIDLVVVDTTQLDRMVNAAKQAGYHKENNLTDEYQDLGAQIILQNTDGCRLDVFHTQIVDTLYFSDTMRERAERLDTYHNLTVELASPEDIFLFKSVTPRATDRDDMNTLLQTGLDTDTILDEIHVQHTLLENDVFITDINEALLELRERFGVTPSLLEDVEPLAERAMNKLHILHLLTDRDQTINELHDAADIPKDDVDVLLKELTKEDRVTITGNTVSTTDTTN